MLSVFRVTLGLEFLVVLDGFSVLKAFMAFRV